MKSNPWHRLAGVDLSRVPDESTILHFRHLLEEHGPGRELFGMKMHIGADDVTGLIHSIQTTPANVHDLEASGKPRHGEEKRIHGDVGYRGIHKRREHPDRKGIAWLIALRPGERQALDPESGLGQAERQKACIRAKVEHPFRTIKQVFGYAKVRYRGLRKNTNRLALLAAFTNLLIGSRFQPS